MTAENIKDEVDEGETARYRIPFRDEDGSPVTPAAATYRIDDRYSGQAVVAATPFTPASSTFDIDIPASATGIINRRNPWEIRVLTVSWNNPAGKVGRREVLFRVIRLAFP